MGAKKSDRTSDREIVATTAPAYLFETWHAKGLIELTPDQLKLLEKGGEVRLPGLVSPPVLKGKRERRAANWIDAIEAVHLLAPHLGGDANAKAAIAARLKDCAIECTCLWQSFGPDTGRPSMNRPDYPTILNNPGTWKWVTPVSATPSEVIMGPAIWAFSGDWERDVKTWNWASGLFVTRGDLPASVQLAEEELPRKALIKARHVAAGVRFYQRDIEAIAGIQLQIATPRPKKKGDRPGPKRAFAWEHWTAELATLIEAGGVDWKRSAKEIHENIVGRLEAKGLEALDYDTVEKAMSVIKARIRKARNEGEI